MIWPALRGAEARHRGQIIKPPRITDTWQPMGSSQTHAGGEHCATPPGSPEGAID